MEDKRMIIRQSNAALLNEHWKRKQRLKPLGELNSGAHLLAEDQQSLAKAGDLSEGKSDMIDTSAFGALEAAAGARLLESREKNTNYRRRRIDCEHWNISNANFVAETTATTTTTCSSHHPSHCCKWLPQMGQVTGANDDDGIGFGHSRRRVPTRPPRNSFACAAPPLITFTWLLAGICILAGGGGANGQSQLQSDPRPTIYSGQVSFGLLLSAHSSLGAELATSASHQVVSLLRVDPPQNFTRTLLADVAANSSTRRMGVAGPTSATSANGSEPELLSSLLLEPQFQLMTDSSLDELVEARESRVESLWTGNADRHSIDKRQIFERTGQHRRQQQQQQSTGTTNALAHHKPQQQQQQQQQQGAGNELGICSQVNANALYAGMGAIWASHQANLVGDSHLAIGTYVYDSCNDLDVGQRQSVRIVSNLNAFQQTTCESPRGSPISLTIAHGDNQLRAIQLLTSFRVPVITTKENFALEDYQQLTRHQKRFLFSTAHSSRHLAAGALRFSKRIVMRSTSSPKLANQFHKMSPKNGLIVISRNLPARFIAYLTEMIPNHVNYEMLQSNQPIDQIRSVEALESILIKSSAASESKLVPTRLSPPQVAPKRRQRRSGFADPDSDSSGADGLQSEFDTAEDPDNAKMLSPTILMFITPSEAIDLVTRLRNDLAEVSRYYSLIVATREDISPALKTIFHRGGSRLCSGKAFYTISPKPDDIGEFSRYFRDTVQMEGESSDHPLVCEFAKYQASSKITADLDDISTEPVIKAVWAAAAAFKSVYRRDCANLASTAPNTSGGLGGTSDVPPSGTTTASGSSSARQMNSRQSSKSAHAECLVKMNKNMSNSVQRALKSLNVTINSTGLQSLDGFQLRFDDWNELMTNKFSIKYINKECEITEIGHYSGYQNSILRIDEDTLMKSLEGSMPDPWPTKPLVTPTQTPTTTTTSTTSATRPADASKDSATSGDSSTSSSLDAGGGESGEPTPGKRRKGKRGGGGGGEDEAKPEEEETTPTIAGESSELATSDAPKRNKKRSRPSDEKVAQSGSGKSKKVQETSGGGGKKKQLVAAPVTAMGGKNILPGVTDTDVPSASRASTVASPGSSTAASTTSATSTAAITTTTSNQKPMRKLRPFPSPAGTTLKDWLPVGEALTTANTKMDNIQTTTKTPRLVDEQVELVRQNRMSGNSDEQLDEMMARPTTQPPVQSTLPESDGNADLELPSSKSASATNRVAKSADNFHSNKLGRNLQVAATMQQDNTDYVTAPSISTNLLYNNKPSLTSRPYPMAYQNLADTQQVARGLNYSSAADGDLPIVERNPDYLRDLNVSPIPLAGGPRLLAHQAEHDAQASDPQAIDSKQSQQYKVRSQMRWIYSSWYALTILGANICGALLTLYVLTFLLMRNCDGSLDRDNQGIRSIHLLAIIVVFFGSTLFIVYPTPGLCLLRTSWHNFALVMLFGSLLLQAMQTRSLGSLGLGGRPNRLNQFLTLIFMVGVQVSFEIQRWKYESANYMHFVNQYFGGMSATNGDRRFMIPNTAISDHFNPLNSFLDQVTPVNIQISEHYQNLLQDYCLQQVDDFLQSQIYLCLLVGLAVLFSASNRRKRRLSGATSTNHHQLKSTLTSGKLVASQHETNLNLSPSHFQFATSTQHSASVGANTGNIFMVTIIGAFIYSLSVVLHIYGQNTANRDLIASITMVLIASTTLIGIFLPILLAIHRLDSVMAADNLLSTLSRPVVTQSKLQEANPNSPSSPSTSAFTMFPEFAPTGLRRPASTSGESSSGAGSRRTFAETKESRRNMGAVLANLGPSADSLRNMGFYAHGDRNQQVDNQDPSLLNLKLNLSAIDEPCSSSSLVDQDYGPNLDHEHQQHCHHNHAQHQAVASNRKRPKGEKRLIMLDVDPCCPRHGLGAWPKIDEQHSSNPKGIRTSKNFKK